MIILLLPYQRAHAKEFSLFREIDHLLNQNSNQSFKVKLIKFVVKRGDNLSGMLRKLGIDQQDIHSAMQTLRIFYNPKKLKIGQEISAVIHLFPSIFPGKRLHSLSMKTSPEKEISVERHLQNDFLVFEKEIDFEKQWGFAQGKIESNLYETVQKMGIPHDATSEIFQALRYDVDFERDLQGGNGFKIVYERFHHLNGEFSHYGKIVYASLELDERTLDIYRHTLGTGDTEYFSKDGTSVKKSLMKTPITNASVSSNFGMRKHPILSYTRLHKGVDFRASKGTPIMAAGNGVIKFIGRKGGYGNYLIIRHNGTQSTAYAHIHRFAKGIKRGSRVKQGEIVAYVGSTGRSTGPHLHYEVLQNGVRVNPLTIKATPGGRLKGKELSSFINVKDEVQTFLVHTKNMQASAHKNFDLKKISNTL